MSMTPMFCILNWKTHRLKVIQIIHDAEYGEVCSGYLNHKKVYIIDKKVVKDQKIIDDLDDKYWIPVKERGIYD